MEVPLGKGQRAKQKNLRLRNVDKLKNIGKNGSKAHPYISISMEGPESLLCKSLGSLHILTSARKQFLVLSRRDRHCHLNNFLGRAEADGKPVSSWVVANRHLALFSPFFFFIGALPFAPSSFHL